MTAARRARGLVLGGGGVLGAAWMVGALRRSRTSWAWTPASWSRRRHVGRLRARGLLAAGVAVRTCWPTSSGGRLDARPLAGYKFDYEEDTGGDRPPGRGSGWAREAAGANARQLRQLPPTAVLSAIVPEGRGSIDRSVPSCRGWPRTGGRRARVSAWWPSTSTPAEGGVRPPRGPAVTARPAVMASCAIPGWYQPVRLGAHRYIDGGAWSSTNLDLMVGQGLDEVFVLAPQVSFVKDAPRHWRTRVERQWRNRVTLRCLRELAACTGTGPT